MGSVAESMDQIIYVGVGIFVLILVLDLSFQGYAQGANQILSTYCNGYSPTQCASATNTITARGIYINYTAYAGPLPNTFGGALQLAVFALVFIAIILAIVGALRGGSPSGASGGFLK